MGATVLRYRVTVALVLAVMYLAGLLGIGLFRASLGDQHDPATRGLLVAALLALTIVELLASAVVVFGLHRLMLGGRRAAARWSRRDST